MNNNDSLAKSWQTPLIVAIAVILVVLAALILTQIDDIQRRSLLPPKRLTVIDQESTIVAGELDTVYLPGYNIVTATPSVTPQSTPTILPEATAVPLMIQTCDIDHEDWVPHIVQRGESLTSLAFKYGISKNSIIQANCLTLEKLIWGQMIYLPQEETSRPEELQCGVPPNWIHYVVHPGDTLMQLAEKYDSTVYTIMNANCLETTNISPGRKLFLPSLQPTEAPPTRENPSPTRLSSQTTATATQTRPYFPTFTPTLFPSATATQTGIQLTPSPSSTGTPIPIITNTATPLPPTPTETLVVPTETATIAPSETATNEPTETSTAAPPSPTFTATAPLPTATSTPLPPLPTSTSTPMLATSTATISVHPPGQPTATGTSSPYP